MAEKRIVVHNKSDKPDNIVKKEGEIVSKCEEIQQELPYFLRGFFMYLIGNVLPRTRYAYLCDILFFFNYLISETDLTKATRPKDITVEDVDSIEAVDVNMFLNYCRNYSKEGEKEVVYYKNSNNSLARKKSSISVLFKYLYRENLVKENITLKFDPIKQKKVGEREIKALEDDEVMKMLDAVSTGVGLSSHQKSYWEKTKKRDKAILILFVTYGLRISELTQLNLSSFNFSRGEFIVYRKRGKESLMPFNRSVEAVLRDYINLERPKILTEEEGNDPLFLSLQGTRMTERQIRELVKKYTAIALNTSKKKGYSPHKLRATAATSLIGRGNSIFDVAALLDHENVTTTQLYARQKRDVKHKLVSGMEWEKERVEDDKVK